MDGARSAGGSGRRQGAPPIEDVAAARWSATDVCPPVDQVRIGGPKSARVIRSDQCESRDTFGTLFSALMSNPLD